MCGGMHYAYMHQVLIWSSWGRFGGFYAYKMWSRDARCMKFVKPLSVVYYIRRNNIINHTCVVNFAYLRFEEITRQEQAHVSKKGRKEKKAIESPDWPSSSAPTREASHCLAEPREMGEGGAIAYTAIPMILTIGLHLSWASHCGDRDASTPGVLIFRLLWQYDATHVCCPQYVLSVLWRLMILMTVDDLDAWLV